MDLTNSAKHMFRDLNQKEKLSEIKPPLGINWPGAQQRFFFKISIVCRYGDVGKLMHTLGHSIN